MQRLAFDQGAHRFGRTPLECRVSHHCMGCLMMVFHFDGSAFLISLK